MQSLTVMDIAKIIHPSDLPDGTYSGKLSGYNVEVVIGEDVYNISVMEGIRGINIPCKVTIENDIVSIEVE